MKFNTVRKCLAVVVLMSVVVPLAGCGKSEQVAAPPPAYEGQYKNARGATVLEIKDGKAMFTDPRTRAKVEAPFSPAGDKLMIESASGTFTLTFQAPDTITGLPATIAGTTDPLKKS
ncbi:hypothetical protein [Humisphaera borealis]|uniref:Uncharacterized protein n=1 Tax=Humisphaera borealis TaxID=2807512 RepID=A0A7M2WTL1_9BACT|nr:hypothetical protein [Humisphaera borealis]QOV88779.1 hypothetical protein IPV69_21505 [Humisphaera borealis]